MIIGRQPQQNHLLNESITIVGFDLLGNMGVWAFFINPARTFV
ncbi:putative membrane protein [Acinetobacter baumannii 44327_2]|uniref:Uncharacterized protein n=3 Tax=Acinetobacter baumannii TaxID=470 RepID=A0A828SMS0_ACIBA|nr:hypothetical protein HMPREF0020_03970 [Acinetobacter baumannii 6013113]EGJ67602.1 hypothetical protein HMPREF0022_02629 [Acinetobacter baumannii 6014059]ETQ83050.1 hypothetical protein P669_3701 [Acinetobacter baumannii UH5307]ETR39210.1 hypothetical protein P686_3935 [Acinetobacter baumannii UH9707]EXA81774.1 putative membrane protein [Acinetobacter baumannii 1159076]EXB16347.1 putative membrane protein [Acinetobacter baumannii 1397084]EXC43922.1 putative membrane protein [Acinetobacter b